jgi:PAS domain S-box-containing protein
MPQTLRVLIVEDSEDDTLLLLHELRRGPWKVTHQRVDTPAAMSAALTQGGWDLILSDYSMPRFSGPVALAMAIEHGNKPPFILISGLVGEETAVQAMKAGADDYLSKSNLVRLLPAVERELHKAAGAIQEITNRKRVEKQLAESQERLRGIIETAMDAIITVDDQLIVTLFNPAAERMFQWQALEIIGTPLGRIIPPRFHANLAEHIHLSGKSEVTARALAGADPLVGLRCDGIEFPIEATISHITVGGQKLYTAMVRDISEHVRVESKLAKAMEAAEAANRTKSEFLANMSHEIRTPMTAILGFAEMLQNKSPKECSEIGCVQIIRRNALHLLELINEILDLSKIEASEMTIESIACDLPEMLSDVIALMRSRASEKSLGFGITFAGPIPRLIQIDPTRLRQILVNLLGNAIKFTTIGNIHLKVSDKGAGSDRIVLRIEVIDSGIGMTNEQMARLFQPFTQGDESITRKFGGTGLGLTISRHLARLLNGDITVLSGFGIGSTFILEVDGGPSTEVEMLKNLTEDTLPVRARDAVHHSISLKGRILLVEDGRDNQRLLHTLLTDAGAVVAIADNGQIGVQLATTEPFDLILMDMQMPVMDGYAATSELRRLGIKTPIIALTAFAMAEDRVRCIAIGCTAYLSKPVDEDTLLETVGRHLAGAALVAPVIETKKSGVSTLDEAAPDNTVGDTITSSFADNPRMKKIIPAFVDRLPAEVQKMIDLLDSKDMPALKRVVHQLLGACGGYGFDPVTEPARRAEESIKTNIALDLIAEQVNSLIEVIRRIEGYDETEVLVSKNAE